MNHVGLKKLWTLTKRYGFKNVVDFSAWVEDNNLVNALEIKEEDEEDEEILKEDKNSRKYKAKVLALEILQLPDVQKELRDNPDISIDKWQEWARKAKRIKEHKVKQEE